MGEQVRLPKVYQILAELEEKVKREREREKAKEEEDEDMGD